MYAIVFGIITVDKFVHPVKTYDSILVKLSGIIIDVRLLQS